jgi:PAS domain S-box-containing protein
MGTALDTTAPQPLAERGHLHDLLESISTGVVALDLEGKIVTFNRAAEQITGLKSNRAQGSAFDEVFEPGYFQNMPLTFSDLIKTEHATEIETQIYGVDKNGTHVSLAVSPLKSTRGRKTGIVLCLTAITQTKKLEAQANRTGRLAAMGEMAVKIAHEIRNPLGSIELFSTMLSDDLQEFEDLKALAEHISSGVKSINNIVSNLLLFIRPDQQPEHQVLDVHEALHDSLFFAGHLIDAHNSLNLTVELADHPLTICGDLELLKQIFLNLILNAIQAMPNGGNLRISTRKILGHQGIRWAEIRFADTGCGITQIDLPKVFDPFYTTKKKGTGLGLTIVHNITKMHGGSIDISSCEAQGTDCVVTLPLWVANPNAE